MDVNGNAKVGLRIIRNHESLDNAQSLNGVSVLVWKEQKQRQRRRTEQIIMIMINDRVL